MLVKVYSVGICHSQLAWKYSKRSKVWHLKAFFSWKCSYKIRKNISPLVNSATSNLKKLRQYSALISSLWRQLKSLSRKNILQWESLEQNLPICHHSVEAGCVARGGVFCLTRYLSPLGFWNIEFEKSSLMNWNFCLVWTRFLLPV